MTLTDEQLVTEVSIRARAAQGGRCRKPSLSQVRSELALLIHEGSKRPPDLWGLGLSAFLAKLGLSYAVSSRYRVAGRAFETMDPRGYREFFRQLSMGRTVSLPPTHRMLRAHHKVTVEDVDRLVSSAIAGCFSVEEARSLLLCLEEKLTQADDRLDWLQKHTAGDKNDEYGGRVEDGA